MYAGTWSPMHPVAKCSHEDIYSVDHAQRQRESFAPRRTATTKLRPSQANPRQTKCKDRKAAASMHEMHI